MSAETECVLCLDTSVIVKYLTPDEQDKAATVLVERALRGDARLVAPGWAWAEVGSVLRKKVRARLLEPDEAQSLWGDYLALPIRFVENPHLRTRAWALTVEHALPTLYDATFLACTELALAPADAAREFWTADRALLRQLGAGRPAYVRELGE